MRLETLAVHAGADIDPTTGAVAPPIHLSTTFEHGPACEETHGYSYIREKNPTQTRLEEAMAKLEGGETALAFASGMGALCCVMQSLGPGSHVIFPDDAYTGFRNLYREFLSHWGIEYNVVDMTDHSVIKGAVRPNTKIVVTETPSNPMMKITDLAGVAEITPRRRSRSPRRQHLRHPHVAAAFGIRCRHCSAFHNKILWRPQ